MNGYVKFGCCEVSNVAAFDTLSRFRSKLKTFLDSYIHLLCFSLSLLAVLSFCGPCSWYLSHVKNLLT